MKVDLIVEVDDLEEDASPSDLLDMVQAVLAQHIPYLTITVTNAEDY